MSLSKAIEILHHLERGHYNDEPADQTNALKLAIKHLEQDLRAKKEYPL